MELTKICTKCKRELSLENFRWKNKAEGKHHSQCKECQRTQEKIHYKESSQRQEAVKNTAVFQKNRNTLYIAQIKENGYCAKCKDCRFYVLDFHHKNPEEKVNEISYLVRSAGLETLKKEVDKCVLLCSNCHREFHHLEREQGITIEEYLLE